MVVVTIAVVGVVAASRLIADATRDLADEVGRLRSIQSEADGLIAELHLLAGRRARGDHERR